MVSITQGPAEGWYSTDRQADPADNRGWLDTLADGALAIGVAGAGRVGNEQPPSVLPDIISASWRANRYTDLSNSRARAEAQAYRDMVSRVRDVAGVQLENPDEQGYQREATRRMREMTRNSTETADLPGGMPQLRRQIFAEKLEELRQSRPELADQLIFDLEASQRALALTADSDLKRLMARDDIPLISRLAGNVIGGIGASVEDPYTWASLPFGGPGAARTAVGRVMMSALSNAGVNAGFTAAIQPAVQGRRAELGLKSGWKEAASNVLMAAGAGFVLGGSFQGLGEWIAKAGRPTAAGAERVLREAGVFVDDEVRAGLRGAERADAASREAFKPPKGMPADEVDNAIADGIVAHYDPEAPLPLGSRVPPAGTTDELAQKVFAETPDIMAALPILRGHPAAVASALASDVEHVRLAGHIASLDDVAFGMVMRGEAEPLAAAIVARMSDDGPMQAAMLARIRQEGATAIDAIRGAASDVMREAGERRRILTTLGAADEIDPVTLRTRELVESGAERDNLRAFERAGLETTMADPEARRIIDDVAGQSLQADAGPAPRRGEAPAQGQDAGAGAVRADGPNARADRGDAGGAAGRQSAVRDQVPVELAPGQYASIERADIALVGERDRMLADLALACQV